MPLPAWVLRCGDNDPDIFFTDRPRGGSSGQRNREYISVWADEAAALCGRTPIQCYEDFMASFRESFSQVRTEPQEESSRHRAHAEQSLFPCRTWDPWWKKWWWVPGHAENCASRVMSRPTAGDFPALASSRWVHPLSYSPRPRLTVSYVHKISLHRICVQQCYDRRALASLAEAAGEAGHPDWGYGGPHDTGDYNSNPEETGFYNHEGSWDSPYGR